MRLGRAWVFLAALLLALVGCAGERAAPKVVVVPAPTREAGSPLEWRYVSLEKRLVLPTATVVPTPTRRPTPVMVRMEAVLEAAAPAPVEERAPETRGCVEHYRDLLAGAGPRPVLGAEVAWRLSEELVGSRPECLEEGWSPELGLEVQCGGSAVGGVGVARGLLRFGGQTNRARLGPTGRDEYGNVLVHFRRLPLVDGAGCWYYQASRDTWGWRVLGGESGVWLPEFPGCEARVREGVSRGMLADLGVLHVARVLDGVRREHSAECGDPMWGSYPRRGGYAECGVQAETGVTEDGTMVVNWHERHPALGGVLCWVRPAGAQGWEDHPPVPGGVG